MTKARITVHTESSLPARSITIPAEEIPPLYDTLKDRHGVLVLHDEKHGTGAMIPVRAIKLVTYEPVEE